MLFGRRKEGFTKVEKVTEFPKEINEDILKEKEKLSNIESKEQEKPDLLDYLDELEDVEDLDNSLENQDIEEAEEKTEAELLAEFIRIRSKGAYLTSKSSLEKEEPKLEELLDNLSKDEGCQDIVYIKGDKDVYYYSNEFMSDNYAMIAMLVEDKDMPRTIAEMVRWNGKTYPCATPLYYFKNSPYFYTDAQIERALGRIRHKEEYSDICELTTGNNVRYLYSTIHMSEKYARALAEGVEYGEYGYR
ncbi:hypothetical protein [Wansuia hejianensis]|uniref:Uncharacterized protein n=1 Tax=Wansuia hejianensis TaxID=2763667 RepID=A0A926F322_9FIRM|nr:hypothetical protein [Wansuia hejianensis]MBC8591004.1 hypothetical protein [Wansuia hejianensis]